MTFFKKQSFTHYKKFLLSYIVILIIPIFVIGTINYNIMRGQYFASLKKSINFELNDRIAFLNNQLSTMNAIIYNCKRDKIYNTRYQENPVETYFDIVNDLKEKEVSVAMFSRIYYFNSNQDYIISADGKYDKSYFFSKHMNMDTLETINIQDITYSTKFTAIKTKIVDENKNSVILITPLEIDYSYERPVSYLMFEIYDSELNELFLSSKIHPDSIGFLYFNDKPIYSNSSLYNDLLFNDKDIEKLLEKEDEKVMYQYSSDSIFDIKLLVPKLIYNQILIELVFIQGILMLIVLGLGFWLIFYFLQKNYKPIKHIIQNVSNQYHQDGDMADEFKYISFVINDLLCAKELLEESNHDLKNEKYLYSILSDQVQKESSLYFECLEAGIKINENYFSCIIMDQVTDNESICRLFNEEFTRQSLTVSLYFLNLAEERYLYLLCSDNSLSKFLECIKDAFSSAGFDEIKIGIGKMVNSVSKVNCSYTSAQSLLLETINRIEYNNGADVTNKQNQVYPKIEIESLKEAVINNNIDKIDFAFNNIKKVIENNNIETVNVLIYTEIVRILTASEDRDNYLENILQLESLEPEAIIYSLEEVYNLYINESHSVLDTMKESSLKHKNHKNIGEMLKYINENYQGNYFSVKYMAMEYGTTSSNLSHYFKKCTGKNISQYIDELKMQRAKELLEENNGKVSDIATQLGYNNTSVFIETFKKYEGMTPGMYRASKNREISY